ncbi:MAG: hypothetical protein HY422_03280 [Candidatus Komeilibacteria bacterium]|nr:hypothetical protein [Candidatus Komeilibacteria bacterium]
MKRAVFIVTRFDDGELHYGLLHDRRYEAYIRNIDCLDSDLLQVIDTTTSSYALEGIAVDRSGIRGFASIRLLLTTLNFIAWLRDIPIVPISTVSAALQDDHFNESVLHTIRSNPHFTEQLLPEYAGPAGVTVTTRSKKFRLLRKSYRSGERPSASARR